MRDRLGDYAPHLRPIDGGKPQTGSSERLTLGEPDAGGWLAYAMVAALCIVAVVLGVWVL